MPQRPPIFAGRSRTADEVDGGWFDTAVYGQHSEAAVLPSTHHAKWDADGDMKLLWSGGQDVSGTTLRLGINETAQGMPSDTWRTTGTGVQSHWQSPQSYKDQVSRYLASTGRGVTIANSTWAGHFAAPTGASP